MIITFNSIKEMDDFHTNNGGLTKDQVMLLLKPMETAIETQASYLKHLANGLNTSNHNVDTDINQLYQTTQGIKKDIADLKTHFGNNSQIVDNIMNKVIANENQLKLLKPKLLKHIETGSLLGIPIGSILRTTTKWGKYQYEYMIGSKVVEATETNEDLKIFNEGGFVALTPLKSEITTFSIFSL